MSEVPLHRSRAGRAPFRFRIRSIAVEDNTPPARRFLSAAFSIETQKLRNYLVVEGRNWVVDTQRGETFATEHHARLGAGSRLLVLDAWMVRRVLDRVL